MKRKSGPPPGGRNKDRLRHLGVTPSKQRGQNFIIDPGVIEEIVSFGAPTADERVVEIGPGLGALTEALLQKGPLTAIEIEERFCLDLQARFPSLHVINQDVRTVDFSTIGSDLTVFGNLPYVFSTEIVFTLIDQRAAVRRAVLLLQREFAERLAAPPGGRDYGTISVACAVWADLELGPVIAGDRFHPPTKVESRLVELRLRTTPRVDVGDPEWFRKVVKAGFLQRRKKLSNSLAASGMFSRAAIAAALEASSIDGSRRAETLSLEEFARMAEALRVAR